MIWCWAPRCSSPTTTPNVSCYPDLRDSEVEEAREGKWQRGCGWSMRPPQGHGAPAVYTAPPGTLTMVGGHSGPWEHMCAGLSFQGCRWPAVWVGGGGAGLGAGPGAGSRAEGLCAPGPMCGWVQGRRHRVRAGARRKRTRLRGAEPPALGKPMHLAGRDYFGQYCHQIAGSVCFLPPSKPF